MSLYMKGLDGPLAAKFYGPHRASSFFGPCPCRGCGPGPVRPSDGDGLWHIPFVSCRVRVVIFRDGPRAAQRAWPIWSSKVGRDHLVFRTFDLEAQIRM
jgi:hypothetical protein